VRPLWVEVRPTNPGLTHPCIATSTTIVHSDKPTPTQPNALFPIVPGLVAINNGWKQGLHSSSFRQQLAAHSGDATLSLGLALEDQFFSLFYDTFDLDFNHGELFFC
jgi:hypothetical protein